MRRSTRSRILVVVALVALSGAGPAWAAGEAWAAGGAGAAGSVPVPMAAPTSPSGQSPSPTRTPSPTPTRANPGKPPCHGCLSPLDTICWEYVSQCAVPVNVVAPLPETITAQYRTFPITAKSQLDYVEVTSGTVVIQPGKTSGDAVVTLLPDPDLGGGKTFGVELFGVPDGVLGGSKAIVTITPGMG